jgi:hypothetical protein
MKRHMIVTPAAVILAMAVASTPAFAGQRERDGRGAERSHSDRAEKPSPAVERARPHADVAPRAETRPQESGPRAVPRSEVTAPRVERPAIVAPRVERPVIVAPRVERPVIVTPRVERPVIVAPRAERPVIVAPRVERPVIVAPRSEGPREYRPRSESRDYRPHYEPRFAPHPRGYPVYRPYVFRPRLHLNFGVWLGYSAPFAYAYPVPVYGYYAPRTPVVVGPESTMYGGVSLEITPSDAFVYVDGTYAGTVRDFDGTDQPLTLAAGTHHIEIQATGYEPVTMDVAVQPGQVIPYRGDMRPW